MSDRKIKSILVGPTAKKYKLGWNQTIYFTRDGSDKKYTAVLDMYFFDYKRRDNGELNIFSGTKQTGNYIRQEGFRWKIDHGKLIISNNENQDFKGDDYTCDLTFSNDYKKITSKCIGPNEESVTNFSGVWSGG